jgi:hypothetical protein
MKSNINELTPTRLAYLRKRVQAAQNTIPDSIDSLKALYERGMALAWAQEGDIGPAELFESLGTEGAELFINGVKLLEFILSQDPDWIYPKPTHKFTLNEDGSVSIHEPIEEL